MAKLITAAQKIQRARELIQEARDLPIPVPGGRFDFSYVAQVKDLLGKARDQVKFISRSRTATAETRAEVQRIIEEIKRADKEILRPGLS